MKMRKLMAVLLAVVVAISAMAISVFADDVYTIDMYNYSDLNDYTYTATYTIEVPVYNLYGYSTDSDSITLNLPTNLANAGYADYTSISYTLSIGGVTVSLKSPTTVEGTYDTFDQVVEVGTFQRDYYSDSYPAMIPQSLVVNTSAVTMTITAYVDYTAAVANNISAGTVLLYQPYQNYSANGAYYDSEVVVYTDSEGAVSVYYGAQAASITYSTATSTSTGYITIVTDVSTDSASVYSDTLTWDHTLGNRATLFNAYCTEGSTVKLIVELEGNLSWITSINGTALYGLSVYGETLGSSTSAGNTSSGLWYGNSTASALNTELIDTYLLSGSTSTLEFEIPVSYLYDSTYGLYNGTMMITQLSHDSASSGTCYYNYTADWSTFSLTASAVYLEVTIPSTDDDTTVDMDEPVEDSTTETEEDGDDVDVNDTDDAEPETNPTTGIVLALVPMAVAAAAAVASKRR